MPGLAHSYLADDSGPTSKELAVLFVDIANSTATIVGQPPEVALDFVNPDGRGQGWWSETALRRTWATACRKIGVTGVSLYEGTKHSTATHLKALGADDPLLAALMGHRDPRSVEKYAKLNSSAIRAGLERLRKRGRG